MARQARRGGAVELLRAFDPLGGHRLYVAPSRSTPGTAYVLREAPDGRWLCGCPRFFFRATCPHVEALYALLRPSTAGRRYPDGECGSQ